MSTGSNLAPISIDQLNTLTGINTQTTIQAQIDGIGTTLVLDDGKIFVGNASNVPTDIALSGGLTITNTGLATLGPNNGYATTATAATTTTLTVASKVLQFFTGVTTQTVTLPVTSTLALGWKIRVVNLSTGTVTVNSSGANAVATIVGNAAYEITCIAITGTSAASWNAIQITGFFTNPMTTGGDVIYGGASGVATRLANGTVNQFLRSAGGTAAPTWAIPIVDFTPAALTNNFAVATDHPTFANVTGLTQTVTTVRANQRVHLDFICSALMGVATTFLDIAYNIDGGADVALVSPTVVASSYANVSCSTDIIIAAAGTYVFQIRSAKAGTNCNLLGVGSAAEAQTTFSAFAL